MGLLRLTRIRCRVGCPLPVGEGKNGRVRPTAQMAKELGLVNEVQPLDRLLPRAWEIAEKIMQKPRAIRRMTSAVLRRQWKRRLVEDLGFHVAHELLGMHLNKSD